MTESPSQKGFWVKALERQYHRPGWLFRVLLLLVGVFAGRFRLGWAGRVAKVQVMVPLLYRTFASCAS